MLGKIGIVGGGNIGGVLVLELFEQNLARRVALMDVKEPDLAKGKCLDIAEGVPVLGSDTAYDAGRSYDVLEGSELVINTAGVPRSRRPDGTIPSREELLCTNLEIADQVAEGIIQYCPEAIVINVANPLDAIVYRLYQKIKPSKNKLMGMAGALDSSRYRNFVAKAAGVSVENVQAMVLGGHGDTMLPIRSCCRVAGMPVENFLDDDTLAALDARTREAGGEIVSLLGEGSAFVSPAMATLEMVESIVLDKKKIIPSCVLLEGEYGVHDLFVGVPVILGRDGVEKIIEIELNVTERKAFEKSVAAVRNTVHEVSCMEE
jgi:malate dehydrogenase